MAEVLFARENYQDAQKLAMTAPDYFRKNNDVERINQINGLLAKINERVSEKSK